jgi:hypothetical protein
VLFAVWGARWKAHELVPALDRLADSFSGTERFETRLIDAAVSVPVNMAGR